MGQVIIEPPRLGHRRVNGLRHHGEGGGFPVPGYATLCHRQKYLRGPIPYRAPHGLLDLLLDSTGINYSREAVRQVRSQCE